ncbi:MAG: diguanylate cyclase, partial [Anaerolineae bacterium]|nr:diguanylate cyclase [Anaerolineae bacterium]
MARRIAEALCYIIGSMMNWSFSAFSILQFFIALSTLTTAIVAWQRRGVAGSRSLALGMAAVTLWAVMTGIETASTSLAIKILCSKVAYIGICSSPVFYLLFIVEYTNQEHLINRQRLVLLWIFPLLTMLVAATNDLHLWLWNSFTPIAGTNLILYGHGPWFWLNVVYVYSLLMAGILLLARAVIRYPMQYRPQLLMLSLGLLFPWLGNIIYILYLTPGEDMTTVGFALSGLCLLLALFRQGWLDLVPVAREQVVEWMDDGLIVLDDSERIVDINLAGRVLLGQMTRTLNPLETGWVGLPAIRIAEAWPDFASHYPFTGEAHHELTLQAAGKIRTIDMRVTLLANRSVSRSGKMILLHDITQLKAVQMEAERARAAAEALFRIGNALSSAPSLAEGLRQVADQTGFLVECDGGLVMARLHDELVLQTCWGLCDAVKDLTIPYTDGMPFEQVQEQLDHTLDQFHTAGGTRLILPVIYQGSPAGLLALGRRNDQPFSDSERHYATSLADQISIAFENARILGQLQEMAITDGLTGLYNRRHFFVQSENIYQHSLRYHEPFSILLLDVDHFKGVNDRYGHQAGDEVLRRIAQTCLSVIRRIDIIGRYGGEEFVAALPNTDLKHALLVAERMRAAVENNAFSYNEQRGIRVTASIGVSAMQVTGESIEHILERADQALYAAKQSGRNTVRGLQTGPDAPLPPVP